MVAKTLPNVYNVIMDTNDIENTTDKRALKALINTLTPEQVKMSVRMLQEHLPKTNAPSHCKSCNQPTTREDYHKNTHTLNGLAYFCKSCMKATARAHYRNSKGKSTPQKTPPTGPHDYDLEDLL